MAEKRVKLAGVRKLIGERMLASVNEIPQISGMVKIDMTELTALTERLKNAGKKISSTSLLVKALGITLTEIPQLNSRLEKEEIVYYDEVNPGIAVNTPGGLLVVVMKGVQDKTLFDIEDDFRKMIDKIRNKKLTMDDTTGGTVTISNLSKEKIYSFNSIINNDECLIIGLGGVQKEATVMGDGSIAPRDISTLTVNMNHTIVDGMSAAQFLGRMQELLQDPAAQLMTSEEREILA